MLQGLVIRVIGHHCPSVEIGRKDKVEGAYPLDHSPRLRLHLGRDGSWAVTLQLQVPSGLRVSVPGSGLGRSTVCLNKTESSRI